MSSAPDSKRHDEVTSFHRLARIIEGEINERMHGNVRRLGIARSNGIKNTAAIGNWIAGGVSPRGGP